MFTPDFLTESQGQMTEAQKKLTSLWGGYQQQLMESQKKLMNGLMGSFPTEMTPASFSESAAKTLDFQKELVNTTLDAQQTAVSMAIETQKQLWESYFEMTQKAMKSMPTAS
jgi:hypothetical protein